MKHLENIQMVGYNGDDITLRMEQEDGTIQVTAMTVRNLFKWAARSVEVKTIDDMRPALKALESMEAEEELDPPDTHIHLEDKEYELIRKRADAIAIQRFGVNSVPTFDKLEELVEAGKEIEKARMEAIEDAKLVELSEVKGEAK
jgi:predicted acylesterase/phospholipase RssA